MARVRDKDRVRGTEALSGFLAAERCRLFDDASAERKERLLAGERRAAVMAAWNKMVMSSPAYEHVTGLHYVPEKNELVVYLDAPGWTQELFMMREILRARMAARGAEVGELVFRTSKGGYKSNADRVGEKSSLRKRVEKKKPETRPLDEDEAVAIDKATAGIEEPALRTALRSAMRANLEWKRE